MLELADQLAKSKMETEELRHEVEISKGNKWMSDKDALTCHQCKSDFTVSRRKVRKIFTLHIFIDQVAV